LFFPVAIRIGGLEKKNWFLFLCFLVAKGIRGARISFGFFLFFLTTKAIQGENFCFGFYIVFSCNKGIQSSTKKIWVFF
jgi:hypothetical protein